MRPPAEASSSLPALLASVEGAHRSFASEVSDESPPGLVTARSLIDGSEDVAAAIRRFQASCGHLDRRVAGMLYVARFSWFAAGAVAVLVSATRLPDLGSDQIAFVLDLPRKRSQCLLRSHRTHALASDPDAVAGGADVVAGVDDLHRILASQFTAVVEPVVDTAAATCRLGRRGLWAMAAASLGNSFLAAGRHLDRTAEACEHMRGVMSHDQRLARSAPIPFPVAAAAGGVHLCRAACCLLLHEPGQLACPTSCPLLAEPIRRAAVESAGER
jgi:hypothetical protein